MKTLIGLLLAFAIGALCRYFGVPVPSPSRLLGALLVLMITLGYIFMDNFLRRKHQDSGPDDATVQLPQDSPKQDHS